MESKPPAVEAWSPAHWMDGEGIPQSPRIYSDLFDRFVPIACFSTPSYLSVFASVIIECQVLCYVLGKQVRDKCDKAK